MGLHSQEVQADGLHGVVAFSFPTEVDRLANTNRSPTADPNGNALSLAVGHVVRQADTNDLYVVRTTSPLAYDQISGAAPAATSRAGSLRVVPVTCQPSARSRGVRAAAL